MIRSKLVNKGVSELVHGKRDMRRWHGVGITVLPIEFVLFVTEPPCFIVQLNVSGCAASSEAVRVVKVIFM